MGDKSKKGSKNLLSLLLIALAVIFVYMMLSGNNKAKEIHYTQFETIMNDGKVHSVNFEGGMAKVLLVDSNIDAKNFPKEYDYYFEYIVAMPIEQITEFNNEIAEAKATAAELRTEKQAKLAEFSKISLTMNNVKTPIIQQMFGYVMFAGFVYVAFLTYKIIMGKGGAGAPNFGKSRAKLSEKSNIKFDNIAGAEEEKEETREIVEFLKNPTKFKNLGARIPKGILLVGEPGTGKTLLAKAVAGESNVPFFSISGSDFVELYVGVGASRVRDLFDTAKRSAPCIIFIDEIDAVGRQRGAGMGGGNDEREQTLNQLLVEMDGFLGTEGIIVLAATNRSDILDPALLRPGRFDRQIYVNVPDVKGREGIIEIHAKNKPIDKDVNIKEIARLTTGFTGADIENFLNEAAILAARDNRLSITMEDITEGINKVLMGPQKKSRLVTEKDRKITAYHEAGHAIIAKLLDSGDNVHEVSIIPRGRAGGYTSTRPNDDDEHFSINKLNNRIAMIMGGRVAEELVFNDITAGASSDITQATKIAIKMVTEWGMSKKVGFVNLGKSNEIFVGRDYQSQKSYSEETAALIDREVKAILDENYEKAVEILTKNRDILDNMSALLLEKETIFADEVDKIMKRIDYKEIMVDIDKREKARKRREAKKRQEAEIGKAKQLQELKLKAAEALSSAGVITKEELEAIKNEGLKTKEEPKLINAKDPKTKEDLNSVSDAKPKKTAPKKAAAPKPKIENDNESDNKSDNKSDDKKD